MQDKKIRLPRVEREDAVHVQEDENQHLWAVSYADFLMALLAFFMLFFSMDEDKREDLIQNLAVHFDAAGPAKSGVDARLPASPAALSADLSEALKSERLEFLQSKRSLTILLPNDFYNPGQFELQDLQKASLAKLFSALKPFSEKIEIYFEGHSDPEPLVQKKSRLLKDNYVLSSLRASSALEFARNSGFDETNLFITASGPHGRGTRSLSLRLEARRELK